MSMVYSLAHSFFQDSARFRRDIWGVLFGEEIQLRRLERGLSVEEAARRAGWCTEEWQAMEAGQIPDSWEHVCAVGEGLGEKRVVMASLVIRYAGGWEDGHSLPGQVRHIYS